jgi:hypothetical protein
MIRGDGAAGEETMGPVDYRIRRKIEVHDPIGEFSRHSTVLRLTKEE